MKKNTFLAMPVMVLVFSLLLIGCRLNNKEDPSGEFTVTINNTSGYPITAYRVVTDCGLGGPEFHYVYTSSGYAQNPIDIPLAPDDNTMKDVAGITVAGGSTSAMLGPFKIVFRGDGRFDSSISVKINYTNGGTKHSSYLLSCSEFDYPSHIALVFNGSSPMSRE
jgi:hypothetical protein